MCIDDDDIRAYACAEEAEMASCGCMSQFVPDWDDPHPDQDGDQGAG